MRKTLLTTTWLTLFSLPALAQDPPIVIDEQEEPPLIEMPRQSPRDEMTELFVRVERRLREIDDLLNDAAAGETSALKDVGEAGIDDLIQGSMTRCREVVKDIEKILEIAANNGGT